jgi:nicotinamide-nucleotide amidase
MPRICLICIGDELLNGHTLEKNAHWLGSFLISKGLELGQIVVSPDSLEDLSRTLEKSVKNYDVVITSGGIGPTPDDLTRKILSKTFDRELVFDNDARNVALENYQRRGIKWDDHKEKLALNETYQNYEYLPQGFSTVRNPVGMAPGLALVEDKKLLLSLPGVPREFISMITDDLLNLMAKAHLHSSAPHPPFIIRTRETPEEKIFFDLAPGLWDELSQFGKVASLPQIMGVDIVISPEKKINQERSFQIKKLIEKYKLKNIVWNYGEESLEEIIIQEALAKKATIATAESCTGGLLGHKLTNVSGASECFLGSVVAYANSVKMNCLNVKERDLTEYGAVSTQVAESMARGVCEMIKADIGLSTSGIAGPSGGSPEKPVGLVAIGQSSEEGHAASFHQYRGNRDELKERFAKKALFNLLDLLRK